VSDEFAVRSFDCVFVFVFGLVETEGTTAVVEELAKPFATVCPTTTAIVGDVSPLLNAQERVRPLQFEALLYANTDGVARRL